MTAPLKVLFFACVNIATLLVLLTALTCAGCAIVSASLYIYEDVLR